MLTHAGDSALATKLQRAADLLAKLEVFQAISY
jgi:hypothetical protein